MSCETCMAAAEMGRAPELHEPCGYVSLFELVGRTVLGIFVAPTQGSIAFRTDTGFVRFDVDGDYCSEAWIADLLSVDALLDAVVVGVEDLDLPNYNVDDGRCRQEVDAVYGIQINTLRGRATLVFRNSSNGYYGGSMGRGVMIEQMPDEWTEVRADWSAPGNG